MKKTLASLAVAGLLVLGTPSVSQAAPPQVAPTVWVYECKWRTAWYDPWNWYGTGKHSCQTVWRW